MSFAVFCLVALVSCGDIHFDANTPSVQAQVQGEVIPALFLGVDANRGACVDVRYARISPGLCAKVSSTIGSSFAINTTCTAVNLASAYGITGLVKSVVVAVDFQLITGTATGTEGVYLDVFSDSGCTVLLPSSGIALPPRLTLYSGTTTAGLFLGRISVLMALFIQGQTTIYMKKTEGLVTGGSTVVQVWEVNSYND